MRPVEPPRVHRSAVERRARESTPALIFEEQFLEEFCLTPAQFEKARRDPEFPAPVGKMGFALVYHLLSLQSFFLSFPPIPHAVGPVEEDDFEFS